MRILLSLLFLLLSFTAPVLAEDISVTAEGYGVNRADALLQAQREAVEKGIGTVLISQTEIKNFELQKDVVITETIGSVKGFDILKDEQQGTEWYLKIKATVSLDQIKSDLAALKILLESMDKPRMMVLIQEEASNNAETAIVDYLQGKGFDLVDPAQVAALMQAEDQLIKLATQGDPVAAAKLGAATGAEYALVGSVSKSTSNNSLLAESGMISGQATLTAKVVNCSNARIVASKAANGAAVHISVDVAQAKAIAKAAGQLMDEQLFEAVIASFQDQINNGVTLEVVVSNVTSYQQQKKVTKALEAVPGVVTVSKRGFGNGELKVSVQFKGLTDAFCDKADGRPVATQALMVTGVAGNSVQMALN